MTVLCGQLCWHILSLSTFVFAFIMLWWTVNTYRTVYYFHHCCQLVELDTLLSQEQHTTMSPLSTMHRPPLISIIRRTISWHPEIAFLPRTETSIPLSQTTSPTWQIHESYRSRRPAECQISSQSEVQSCLCHCLSVTHCSGVNDLSSPTLFFFFFFFFDSLYILGVPSRRCEPTVD